MNFDERITDPATRDEPTDAQAVPAAQAAPAVTGERADLLEALAKQRHFLRFPTRDLTDEQAGLRTTAGELCLGGLIKHVTSVERGWAEFIRTGPSAMPDFTAMTEADWACRADDFRMLPGETLAGVLAAYAEVAGRTDELVATLPDLDAAWPLPKAPWFEAGAEWSARRVLLHIVAETAQHAGHADILRESLDGARSMG
ncbi:DinB family protein [Streptomyces sp. A13(2022)]|uniref:DinB family protein n=1 Tax=Streptomyces sp. A13(2022) TaxID=2964768 RepID=UPI0021DA2EA9|nr:DinB family protein [Streptomyces sp. A13(2022)]MCU8595671.1 DinB family protein [Streptomyces sp. A13(2022)]